MIRIALDAMGGDKAPQVVVDGAKKALETYPDIEIILYGQGDVVRPLMEGTDRLTLVETREVIAMEDEPVKAIRRKKDASMVVAAKAVKEGQAHALVSAGNTGALLAAGLLLVGRIPGVDRPALMALVPTVNPEQPYFLLMDCGANADSKAENVHQFAILGHYYAKEILGIPQPRVGLINNGTEETKGSTLSKAVFQLLKAEETLRFVGNIESKTLLEGAVDVAVTDGFTGNAILKTIEGSVTSVVRYLKYVLTHSGIKTKVGAMFIAGALKDSFQIMDTSKAGGAVLLGVNAPVIKAHGAADATALAVAIGQARTIVVKEVIPQMATFFTDEK